MTGQEQAILGILLMTDGYISYETLAEKLNVSTRTVMRLIRSMRRKQSADMKISGWKKTCERSRVFCLEVQGEPWACFCLFFRPEIFGYKGGLDPKLLK